MPEYDLCQCFAILYSAAYPQICKYTIASCEEEGDSDEKQQMYAQYERNERSIRYHSLDDKLVLS